MDSESKHIREVYAYFGLVFYLANCLEHSVVNALIILEKLERRANYNNQIEWGDAVDRYVGKAFESTLGTLKNRLESNADKFPDINKVMSELDTCLKERNFLAHHFYREYSSHFFSASGRDLMLDWLNTREDLFRRTSDFLDRVIQPLADMHGLTESVQHKIFKELEDEAKKANY